MKAVITPILLAMTHIDGFHLIDHRAHNKQIRVIKKALVLVAAAAAAAAVMQTLGNLAEYAYTIFEHSQTVANQWCNHPVTLCLFKHSHTG